MLIEAGFDVAFECPAATPMILQLSIHPSRDADMLTPDDRLESPVGLIADRIDEGRVAFEFGETERRTQRSQKRFHDVGDDVLGMVEFDAGHKVRVARKVGDHETG